MEIIDRPEPSLQFIEERHQAMLYIQDKFDKFNSTLDDEQKGFRWIKTKLSYPSFDDFTFAYRNKIFSVLVEIAEKVGGKVSFGNEKRIRRLISECKNNNLIPCIYPVMKNEKGGYVFWGIWTSLGCWNLINAETNKFIDPLTEASDELIELSEWEFQNWAVDIVSNYVCNKGFKLLSYCDVVGIEPNIWFEDNEGNKCWIEVLYTKYPDNNKSFSFKNWPSEVLKHNGYKAVVGFANADNLSDKVYRSKAAFVNFQGIEHIYTH